VVGSLDLPSAFNVVNINLLIKRLKVIGLPSDTIKLVSVWFEEQCLFINTTGVNSILFYILLGMVQGSVLWLLLQTIFVTLIFDIADLTTLSFQRPTNLYTLPKNKHGKNTRSHYQIVEKLGLIVNHGMSRRLPI
jgi:hypothetical protein